MTDSDAILAFPRPAHHTLDISHLGSLPVTAKRNPALVIGLVGSGVVGGLFLIACVAVVTAVVILDREESKTYTRGEFRALVVGKTKEQVIAALGRPFSTADRIDGTSTWYYRDKVLNPATTLVEDGIIEFNVDLAVDVRW